MTRAWICVASGMLAVLVPFACGVEEPHLRGPSGGSNISSIDSVGGGGGAGGGTGGSSGNGVGPANVCECVARTFAMTGAACAQCINAVTVPGEKCASAAVACQENKDCLALLSALFDCQGDAICVVALLEGHPGGVLYGGVLGCACSTCGSDCRYESALTCSVQPGTSSASSGGSGGGGGTGGVGGMGGSGGAGTTSTGGGGSGGAGTTSTGGGGSGGDAGP